MLLTVNFDSKCGGCNDTARSHRFINSIIVIFSYHNSNCTLVFCYFIHFHIYSPIVAFLSDASLIFIVPYRSCPNSRLNPFQSSVNVNDGFATAYNLGTATSPMAMKTYLKCLDLIYLYIYQTYSFFIEIPSAISRGPLIRRKASIIVSWIQFWRWNKFKIWKKKISSKTKLRFKNECKQIKWMVLRSYGKLFHTLLVLKRVENRNLWKNLFALLSLCN